MGEPSQKQPDKAFSTAVKDVVKRKDSLEVLRKKFHQKDDDQALKIDLRTAAAALVTILLVVLLIGYVIAGGEHGATTKVAQRQRRKLTRWRLLDELKIKKAARRAVRPLPSMIPLPSKIRLPPDRTEASVSEDASVKDDVNHDSTSTERGQSIHEW
ncbi:hypothetical protein MTO96_051667 [Rhipicephalus appendiculatus]